MPNPKPNPADDWAEEFGFKELVQKTLKTTIHQKDILEFIKFHGEDTLETIASICKKLASKEIDTFFAQTLADLRCRKLSVDQPGIAKVEDLLPDAPADDWKDEFGTTFEKELEGLLNAHSKENDSNTPDFILANFLKECLDIFNAAVTRREKWYDHDRHPGIKEKYDDTQ